MGTWVSRSEVETLLGSFYREIYDEDGDGTAEATRIDQDIDLAEAIVSASLLIGIDRALPSSSSKLVKAAVLLRVKGSAYDRHPEVPRTRGDEFRAQSDTICAAINKGKLLVEPTSRVPRPRIASVRATDEVFANVEWDAEVCSILRSCGC